MKKFGTPVGAPGSENEKFGFDDVKKPPALLLAVEVVLVVVDLVVLDLVLVLVFLLVVLLVVVVRPFEEGCCVVPAPRVVGVV
jgi:hypothetical protein